MSDRREHRLDGGKSLGLVSWSAATQGFINCSINSTGPPRRFAVCRFKEDWGGGERINAWNREDNLWYQSLGIER